MLIAKSKDKMKQQKVALTKENPVLSEEEEMRSEEEKMRSEKTQELSEEEMEACKNERRRQIKRLSTSCNSTSTMVITVSDRKTSKKRHTWE